MKKALLIIFVLISQITFAQNTGKKPLDHSVYDSWKNIEKMMISRRGNFVSYQIDPQRGDGFLYLYNAESKKLDSIPRGHSAKFTPSGDYLVFLIKPQFDSVRQLKLKKVKEDKLPKDSIGIWNVETGKTVKFPHVESFKVAEEESNWLAWIYTMPEQKSDSLISGDTTKTDQKEKKKDKKKKDEKKYLKIYNPENGEEFVYEGAEDYAISENGSAISLITSRNDSVDSTAVHYFNTIKENSKEVFNREGFSKKIALSKEGNKLSFLYSPDTAKIKVYSLMYWQEDLNLPEKLADTNTAEMKKGWGLSPNGDITFSEDDNRIFFGTAPIPEAEPEDTLTEDEKVSLDIWTWRDTLLQPQQQKQLEEKKKENFQAFYSLKDKEMVQLATPEVPKIKREQKGPGKYAIGFNSRPYEQLLSWEAASYKDVYLIDLETGDKELIITKTQYTVDLSPDEKYVVWYNAADSSWNIYDIKRKKYNCLTCGISYPFFDVEFDMPFEPNPYGIAGWAAEDQYILIYDQFDIWQFDPRKKEEPVNLTDFYGRENSIRFRYEKLDDKERFIPLNDRVILTAFDENSKKSGYFELVKGEKPKELIFQDYEISHLKKAEDANVVIFNRGNFEIYPDLYYSKPDFKNPVKISVTNPQQKDYLWGTVEMVHWTSLDGKALDGLLYKPENFDPSQKYPMIVYFYETYSDRLHRHYPPSPSRSVINFTYYLSNGYLIFIPDIVYETGFPGQSAYDAIMSGTMQLAENPWVDKDKIGLQGQSWGGYQVAYLVTQTDYFAAAMAGAPVSNMTSAYGGIRWGSGMSRMFQYEESQSRIGGTLWEKPLYYINNSPLFHAPNVETPLLIMHNDADGAVPWYQGIELFVALRRLHKPVWMLTYNEAPHNLKRRADMKDLTKRMQQFFDHFLKDQPEPVWMKEGVPAIKKGKEFGFEMAE